MQCGRVRELHESMPPGMLSCSFRCGELPARGIGAGGGFSGVSPARDTIATQGLHRSVRTPTRQKLRRRRRLFSRVASGSQRGSASAVLQHMCRTPCTWFGRRSQTSSAGRTARAAGEPRVEATVPRYVALIFFVQLVCRDADPSLGAKEPPIDGNPPQEYRGCDAQTPQAQLEEKDAFGAGNQAVPTRPAKFLLITFDGGMLSDAADCSRSKLCGSPRLPGSRCTSRCVCLARPQ